MVGTWGRQGRARVRKEGRQERVQHAGADWQLTLAEPDALLES